MTWRRVYVQAACPMLRRIGRALEEGRIWYFEDLEELRRSITNDPYRVLLGRRTEALNALIGAVIEMLGRVEMGELQPSYPASEWGIRQIMYEQRGWSHLQGRARPWVDDLPDGTPCSSSNGCYYGMHRYLLAGPTSHAGTIPPEPFSMWEINSICHVHGGEELGLAPDARIYVRRVDGELSWDSEARSADPGHPVYQHDEWYEWFYHRARDEVFIRVNGRNVVLRPNGQLVPQDRHSRGQRRSSNVVVPGVVPWVDVTSER